MMSELFEVIRNMASLSKNTALLLFCYSRQAERSVYYALSFLNEWPQFLAYYDKSKQTQIAKVIGLLGEVGAEMDKVPCRQEFEQNSWSSVIRCSVALLCNPLKHSWSFSTRELTFFSATLKRLLKILGLAEPPDQDELIELRFACFDCHYIIAGKLMGIPEIKKANAIEHFNQSKYSTHVTFEDLGIQIP